MVPFTQMESPGGKAQGGRGGEQCWQSYLGACLVLGPIEHLRGGKL